MKKHFIFSLLFLSASLVSYAQQETLLLWPETIPNSKGSEEMEIKKMDEILRISKVQEPAIEIFLPTKRSANGMAVVICPGGGYGFLSYDWEGTDFAKWLNARGIAGIVLKYRLPDSKSIEEGFKAPIQDLQRAMKLVRANAKNWNIEKDKVGVMGFSAGGHLAATLTTHFDSDYLTEKDSIDSLNARPDFAVLVYPVISMKKGITHEGSKKNLLGKKPSQELIEEFSNELQVKERTPPVFLVHSGDDSVVLVENSILFYEALREKDISAEMHIYPHGGHGFGMALGKEHLDSWTKALSNWLLLQNRLINEKLLGKKL